MIRFDGSVILLDIEGTTSSISYVFDVMFPFVRSELKGFLSAHWDNEPVQSAIDQMASDAQATRQQWLGEDMNEQDAVAHQVIELMDGDSKTTGLKNLQGQIWKSGFESGQLVGHLFEDVAPALHEWNESNHRVFIYSSGSIAAQKLYFGHSQAGDLLPLIENHFDTTIGAKKETSSYQAIADSISCLPGQILFVSDVLAELDAAAAAGLQTAHSMRPGNDPSQSDHHPVITSFAEIDARTELAS